MDVGILQSTRGGRAGELTPRLIRAARSGVGMSRLDLARSAQVSISTVHRAEKDVGDGIDPAAAAKIRLALEGAGAVFFATDGGMGLRFLG